MNANKVCQALGMSPHPEGGAFVETYRDAHSTAIYFLLREGESSHWHRIRSSEIWHYHAGAPLELRVHDGISLATMILGTDLDAGQRPQRIIPPGAWQAARSLGEYTLVGCTVSPPFEFKDFELAPTGWEPSATTVKA